MKPPGGGELRQRHAAHNEATAFSGARITNLQEAPQ